MDDAARKEMSFYLLIGCTVLCIVVLFKTHLWVYAFLAAMFLFGSFYVRWKFLINEPVKEPSREHIKPLQNVQFQKRR